MKVSLNIIRQYIDFQLPPVKELVQRINERLGQVDEVVDLGSRYKDAVIVRIVEAIQHPNADRLRVCKIDDGGVVSGVPRDENGYVQVVCGAPNAVADMYAVWLPPESTVPATAMDAEPFVLSARELRGVLSQGMLAAADELAIGTDHEGIIEISLKETTASDVAIAPGASFARVYGLDDTIIDIENKMFTHRPDCFGQIGVAREIAGIFGQAFTSPSWYGQLPEFGDGNGLEATIFNDAPDKVPRFMAVVVRDITIAPSPLWLRCALIRLGGKPINNVVDITNYVMLLTAQPTHAYDYDKLNGHRLGARMAQEGETAKLLNGKTYTLTAEDVVIADSDVIVGLAGIMGGGESEVSATTKNIILEVASFDMYTLRKSSMRHGVFTDALTRFNKGQSPLQSDRVLQLLLRTILDTAGGQQASPVLDERQASIQKAYSAQSLNDEAITNAEFINSRLGSDLPADEIARLLKNVEISTEQSGHGLRVTAPYWRTDIELPEDIVEEVGRLHGFDALARELPPRSSHPARYSTDFTAMAKARESLARAGANELLTYSFVHERIITAATQDVAKAFGLSNALSPDLQYYRLSLLPSLLDKIHANVKVGYNEFAVFEIGKAHHKDEFGADGLPREFGRVAGIYVNKKPGQGAAYFQAKRLVEESLRGSGVAGAVRYSKLADVDFGQHDAFRQLAAPFNPQRSAVIYVNEQLGGVVGELKQSVVKSFKLPAYTAGFELFQSLFVKNSSATRQYVPLSRFPSTSQDVSLRTNVGVTYGALIDCVKTALAEYSNGIRSTVEPVTIYQSETDTSHITTTLHIVLTHNDRTLVDADVAAVIDGVALAAQQALDAERI